MRPKSIKIDNGWTVVPLNGKYYVFSLTWNLAIVSYKDINFMIELLDNNNIQYNCKDFPNEGNYVISFDNEVDAGQFLAVLTALDLANTIVCDKDDNEEWRRYYG